MAREIVHWPDPVLVRPAQAVVAFGRVLEPLVADMRRVMFSLGGVGLAAPQVGEGLRLVLVCPSSEPGEEEVLVNPIILEREGVAWREEGCLSLPGLFGRVPRAARIRLRVQDVAGRTSERTLEDWEARVVQHELDHLDGVLFPDRMLPEERIALDAGLAAFERAYAERRA